MQCDLCGVDREDLAHFLLECPKLERFRDRDLIGLIGRSGDRIERVGNLLFNRTNIEKVKVMLGKLWKERNIQLINLNKVNRQQITKGNVKKGKNLVLHNKQKNKGIKG